MECVFHRPQVHPAVRCARAGRAAGYAREDALGGIDYAQARFYDPLIGRFLSPDTIVPNPADPQSLNRYSYARNSPLNHADPSGHCSIPITIFGFSLGTVSIGSAACPWDKQKDPPIFDNPLDVDETPPVIDNPQNKDLPDTPIFDGDPRENGDLELPMFDILPTPKPSTGSDIITDPRAPSKLGQVEAKTNAGDRRLDELCKLYGCTKEERRRIGREIEKEKQGAPRGPDGKGSDLTEEEMIDIIEQEIAKRPAESKKPNPIDEPAEMDWSSQ